jgi:hypothetical protein
VRIKDDVNWGKAKIKLFQAYTSKKNKINDKFNKLTTYMVKNFDEIYIGDVNSQLGLKK